MKRISYQLLFWFLLLAIPAEVLMIWVSYRNAEKVIKTKVTNSLNAIASRQAITIERYLSEQENKATIYAQLPEVIQSTTELTQIVQENGITNEKFRETLAKYRKELNAYNQLFSYNNVYMVSNRGEVVFSMNNCLELGTSFINGIFKNGILASLFSHVNTILQTEISDFSSFSDQKEFSAFIATPIQKNRRTIGILIIQINNEEINTVVNNYVGLGETGESLLLSKKDQYVLFNSNTRHAPNAAFKKQIQYTDKQYAWLLEAVSGKSGNDITMDYRQKQVLATWNYIPSLRCGLITKIDVDEAFMALDRLKFILFSILTITSIIVIIVAVFVAKTMSHPIKLLTDYTQLMENGELDLEINVKAKNEIGRLAMSFNTMASKLYESSEQLKNKANELQKTNEEVLTQNEELLQQQEEIVAQRDFIESQNNNLKVINDNMTASIRYAKTIQKSILPSKTQLSKHLGEYFILYEPKDIVSGDYYWTYKMGDTTYIAVVDCTGHGVPGAFMSLIGTSILNDIVIKQGNTNVAEILDIMDKQVKSTLHQTEMGIRDGMDIALCKFSSISNKESKVEFAGAKRSMYYVNDLQHDLQVIKGTRKSIGGYQGKRDKKFLKTELFLPKGTSVYLTTDGFADQQNNSNKKIGSKRLQLLLNQLSQYSMTQHHTILEKTLRLHQQDQKQRDDITVLGFRI